MQWTGWMEWTKSVVSVPGRDTIGKEAIGTGNTILMRNCRCGLRIQIFVRITGNLLQI